MSFRSRFKPLPIEQRLNRETPKIMLQKANASALTGAPLSWFLNIILTIPIVAYGHDQNWHPLLIAGVLWIPFYLASIQRMFTVDLVYAYYKVNIDPSHLIKVGLNRLRSK